MTKYGGVARILAVGFIVTGLSCLTRAIQPGPARADLDLQALIDATPDGAKLEIPYGTWTVEQSLTLEGRHGLTITAPAGTRILGSQIMAPIIQVSSSDNVRIENLYLCHVKPLTDYECEGACIQLDACHDIMVTSCELSGCGAAGVYASEVQNLTVQGCYIHNNTYAAVWLQYAGDVLVRNNRMVDNAARIYEVDTRNVRAVGNRYR